MRSESSFMGCLGIYFSGEILESTFFTCILFIIGSPTIQISQVEIGSCIGVIFTSRFQKLCFSFIELLMQKLFSSAIERPIIFFIFILPKQIIFILPK